MESGNDLLSMGCGHPATTLRFYHSNFHEFSMFTKFANGGICPSPLEKSAILMALACHWLAAIVSPFKDSWFHPLSPVKGTLWPYLTPCFKDNGPEK